MRANAKEPYAYLTLLSVTCLLASFLLSGCAATAPRQKLPAFDIQEATLSRNIDDKGTHVTPIGESTVYFRNDAEVISCVRFKNISGKHTIRWDWHGPDGKLYCNTRSKVIKIPSGKYREEMSLWHRITLKGEEAADFPGRWLVNIYFDNEVISSKHFEIKPGLNIDILPAAAEKQDPSKWGLIIGIEKYPGLPMVDYAKRDAALMKDYFNVVLGVPVENVVTLLDGTATKGKIEGLLRSYFPKNLNSNSIFYVYFAGHGIPSLSDGDAYIVTYDGDPRFIEHTGYKLETFYSDIGLLPVKQSIVFIDGCFSGVSSRGTESLISGARPALLKVDELKLTSENVIALAASKGDQISNAYPEMEHGLFTYFLLSGLRGAADSDSNDVVSLGELYTYVNSNVTKVSRRKGIEQTPVLIHDAEGSGEMKISNALQEE